MTAVRDEVTAACKATGEWTLWVVAAACAPHVTEDYLTGWRVWARETLGILRRVPPESEAPPVTLSY